MFKTAKYSDVSFSNWLALTPPAVIKDHLGFTDETISKLDRFKEKNNQVISGDTKSQNQKRDAVPRMLAGKRAWA